MKTGWHHPLVSAALLPIPSNILAAPIAIQACAANCIRQPEIMLKRVDVSTCRQRVTENTVFTPKASKEKLAFKKCVANVSFPKVS